jgi:hypothetical protein
VKVLRTDQGKELVAQEIQDFMDQPDIAIVPEYSSPYSQYQNSVEREVQTVCKGVSTLLHSQTFLNNSDWDIALSHYIDCRNNIPNTHHATMSPYERCTGRSSDMSKKFLHPFGDLVAVRIPPQLRSGKFDMRYEIGIYVGQPDESVDSSIIYLILLETFQSIVSLE